MIRPAASWLRFAPTLTIGVLAWLALFPITSVDAYYHLATGRRILDERAIPERGVGSATFGSAPWHDNEWGFQVLAAAVGRAERDPSGVLVLTPAGRGALILLRAAALACTLALLSATMARMGAGPVLRSLGVWLAGFLTFGNLFWDVRPQILSYLGFAAVMYLLERARGSRIGPIVGILAVVAAWANVHGMFVVGIALIGCEAAGAWIEAWREPSRRPVAWRLTVAVAAAPLAACLNPLGWRQLAHPFLYLTQPEIYAANNEWTRPDLLHLPLLVGSFVLLAASIALGARLRAGLVFRVALFGGLFLTAIRHLPLAAMTVVPALAAALLDGARGPGWRRRLDPDSGGTPLRAIAILGLAALIAAASGAKFIGWLPRFEERPSRPLPEAEVRHLVRHRVEGNGFNAYRFGGFLMFRMYPEERVFMDGRNDLYGTFRTRVFDPILHTQPGWERLWEESVRRYRLGWVLIDASDPLAARLEGDPRWRPIPVDAGSDGIALFQRVEAPAR